MAALAKRALAQGAPIPPLKVFSRTDPAWIALVDAAQALDDAVDVFIESSDATGRALQQPVDPAPKRRWPFG